MNFREKISDGIKKKCYGISVLTAFGAFSKKSLKNAEKCNQCAFNFKNAKKAEKLNKMQKIIDYMWPKKQIKNVN
jgi:hypothetical protein